MLKIIHRASVGAALLGLGITIGAGCTKDEPEKPKEVVKLPAELVALQAELAAAKTKIGGVSSTMDAMAANAADPRPYLLQFSEAVDGLKLQVDKLQARRDAMAAQGDAYFEKWDAELAKVSSPEIKKRFTDRRDDLLKTRVGISESVKKYTELATPYVSDLQDLKKIIDNDPNEANIQGLAPTFAKLKEKGEAVGKALDEVSTKLTGVAGIYSPGV